MTKINKWIYWSPRILSILFILFLALMSLDVFVPGASFQEIILPLLWHNIPTFVLTIILIFAWKKEIIGTAAFIAFGIAYITSLLMNPKFEWYLLAWGIEIGGLAFLIAYLFYLNWNKKKH